MRLRSGPPRRHSEKEIVAGCQSPPIRPSLDAITARTPPCGRRSCLGSTQPLSETVPLIRLDVAKPRRGPEADRGSRSGHRTRSLQFSQLRSALSGSKLCCGDQLSGRERDGMLVEQRRRAACSAGETAHVGARPSGNRHGVLAPCQLTFNRLPRTAGKQTIDPSTDHDPEQLQREPQSPFSCR